MFHSARIECSSFHITAQSLILLYLLIKIALYWVLINSTIYKQLEGDISFGRVDTHPIQTRGSMKYAVH